MIATRYLLLAAAAEALLACTAAPTIGPPTRPINFEDLECDCGGGQPDEACGGQGCSDPECYAAACDHCYDAGGNEFPCGSRLPSNWRCGYDRWTNDECDCGCGAADQRCGRDEGTCSEPGCYSTACDHCFDLFGGEMQCDWTSTDIFACDGWSDHVCDCGCGRDDSSDCGTVGCSQPSCMSTGCVRCHDAMGQEVPCSPVPPPEWTCSAESYLDTACDCGCGARDRVGCNSAPSACEYPSCHTEGCDRCVSADGSEIDCEPLVPEGWSCDPDWWLNAICDCGCDIPDVDCGIGGCVEPGCKADGCELCWGTFDELVSCQ